MPPTTVAPTEPAKEWRPPKLLISLVLFTANALFAAWDIMSRELFVYVKHPPPPLGFMVIRTLLSCVAAWAYARCTVGATVHLEPLPKGKKDSKCFRWSLLALLAALYTTIGQSCYLYGVKLAGATHAAIMQPLVPVFAMAFGVTLGYETMGTRPQLIGKLTSILLSVAGAAVIIIGSEEGLTGGGASALTAAAAKLEEEHLIHGMSLVFVQVRPGNTRVGVNSRSNVSC